ncbi:sulfatase-like hydrolase/transferase [Pontiella agarivorans]|uniref:Sulfatase-like hydrolase/transferase n=1 Tax=Pontiella agarivorans TaxID=3038953 RepID=A0ABU5MYG6_9BACT|nr:sulfatase-like hydrolase/transferase [Pontiella agarivorans]MDZ8119131.1 sulfatase-like hydrolase/transferase [Pontiella agarivorans]
MRGMIYIFGCLLTMGVFAKQPNVVLIMADDLSHYSVAVYGSKTYSTPNLDRLANTGMRFNEAYALPLCTPSRVAIMTGMNNGRNYIGGHSLELSQVTFGELFRDAGYATCFAGKWKLSVDGSTPGDFGFDEYAITEYQVSHPRFKNAVMNINGEIVKHTKGEYGPDVANAFALDFLERNKDKPFFLYYPMILIHDPHTPTPDSPKYEANEYDNANVPDMVHYMDMLAGNVIDRLEELGLRENTLVIFTGDNGNKKVNTVVLNDGTQYGGGKGWLKDEGVHVPMIANLPGVVPVGTNDDLIDFTDVLPTICDYAGISIPPTVPVDGISFLPQILGRKNPVLRTAIYDWYRNTPKQELQESAFNKEYRLYSNGNFFSVKDDFKEKSALAISEMTERQMDIHRMLQAALDDHALVPVAKLIPEEQSVKMHVGEQLQLGIKVLPENATQTTLRWKSSNDAVVTVNKWGRLTAGKKGNAGITVTSFDGNRNVCIPVSVQ